jgi:hypothetical protein
MIRPVTKILVDGGDPQKTRQIKNLLGFVDGRVPYTSLLRARFSALLFSRSPCCRPHR